MEWSRRAFGMVLSAVLFLATALPALCGKCQPTVANPDCAEDHGKTKPPGGSSSGYTDCHHCDQSQGISATRQMQQVAPELVILLRDSESAPHQDADRVAATSTTNPTDFLDGAPQKYISAAQTHLPKSDYRPLTVSLKI